MLSLSKLQPIICSENIPVAEKFYCDVLGLPVKGRSNGAVVFDVGGSELLVSPVPTTSPSEHTVMGFSVEDVDAVVQSLQDKGVTFERFEHFPHEPNGILMTPDGARVAWFRDPDQNLLSVVQALK